jgi:Family of unknown function (DUF5681)
MDEDKKNGDYPIGFGKPPMHSRFKKGCSGNPLGRPRGAKSAATLLKRALLELVEVREHGRMKKMSKLEVALTQLVNRCVSGDLRAIRFLFSEIPWAGKDLVEMEKPRGGLSDATVEAIRKSLVGREYVPPRR